MDLDAIRDEWDAAAAGFDQEADHGLQAAEVRTAWWRVLRASFPTPPARVGDLGCGTGSVSVLFAEHGYDVIGIDLSPQMIERARAKAEAVGRSIRFEVGNAAEPKLEAGSFDVVFARHVVWALPDPAAALARWKTLLAPDGCFVLVEGRWSTGAGLAADELTAVLAPLMSRIEVQPLLDPTLWGKEIDDVRYLISARR
jgi:SAM-dependent methyltransferase